MSSPPATDPSQAPPVTRDSELLELPAPRRPFRRLTFVVMAMTFLSSIGLALGLSGDFAYALKSGPPTDVGELAKLRADPELANRWVRGEGALSATDVVLYNRPLDADTHRLARVENHPELWVEVRVPSDADGERFVAPGSFVGRLVPVERAGVRFGALSSAVEEAGKAPLSENTWLLLDGEAPRTTRWVIGVMLLLAGFAAFNIAGLVRLSRPVT